MSFWELFKTQSDLEKSESATNNSELKATCGRKLYEFDTDIQYKTRS